LKTRFSSLVPKVSTFQIILVRLCVVSVVFGVRLLLVTCELQAQTVREVFDQLLLKESELGNFAFAVVSPNVAAVTRIDQLDADRQLVAALRYSSYHQRLHAQRCPDISRIDLLAFVTED